MAKKKRLSKQFDDPYSQLILSPRSRSLAHDRVLIGIPMTGLLRSEWVLARYSVVIPCNWAHQEMISWINQASPIGYAVAEARNLIIDAFIKSNAEWLFFVDHDVMLPNNTFVKMNDYMSEKKYPVVSGLYFAKCSPPEPLIYRGRGTGHFRGWKPGDLVWADGIPFGCVIIHRSLIEAMHRDAPEYLAQGQHRIKRVIDTPSGVFFDPQRKGWQGYSGTEDLAWCNRVIAGNYLKKAGWPKIAAKKYPFLVDTGLFCRHIAQDGQTYPLPGFERYPEIPNAAKKRA